MDPNDEEALRQFANGPATDLTVAGSTKEPQRPFGSAFGAGTNFARAYLGGVPVTSEQLLPLAFGELPLQAAQGVRDMINLLMGKPKQDPGHLVAYDKYDPRNGGT